MVLVRIIMMIIRKNCIEIVVENIFFSFFLFFVLSLKVINLLMDDIREFDIMENIVIRLFIMLYILKFFIFNVFRLIWLVYKLISIKKSI